MTLGVLAWLAGCKPRTPVGVMRPPEVTAYEQGQKWLQSGNVKEAQVAFDQAMHANAGYAPPYVAQAQIEAVSGNTARAIELLEAARKIAPQTPHLTCHLAELHAVGGHFVEQWTAAKLAVEQEPDCGLATTQYALALSAAGMFREAAERLQTVHQRFPQDERATLALAQMLAKSGRPDTAWKLMDTVPAQSPRHAQADYVRAWLLAEYGKNGVKDDAGALPLLVRVLADAPADTSANLLKARILLRRGDAAAALKCLQSAQRPSVPSVEWATTLADVQTHLRNPAGLRMARDARAFSALVDRLYAARQQYIADPNSRNHLVALARLEAAVGNAQDAQTLLTQVLQQNPNDAEALKLLTPEDTPAPKTNSTVPAPPTGKPPTQTP